MPLLALLLFVSSAACAAEETIVARVLGRPVHASELRPSADEMRAKEAALGASGYRRWLQEEQRARLRETIWRELARPYANGGPELDRAVYLDRGGRVVAREQEWIPIDARTAYLKEAQAKHRVEILDASYAGALAWTDGRPLAAEDAKTYFEHPWWRGARERLYAVHPLGEAARIDCASGFSFVVRQRGGGRWVEETKTQAGIGDEGYATIAAAASRRCS